MYVLKGLMVMKKRVMILIIILVIIVVIGIYFLYRVNFIQHKMYSNDYFNIETYVSDKDFDGDGIDDQTDILLGVRKYIATLPKYKSKYYGTGYPDDGYGVCTDVVLFGLLDAGYDLMDLVNIDIKENKSLYDVDVIDKNIDFRRVRNLKVYFARNAISLSTDINDISKWQGGDIVIFSKHIGIVSDKRNYKGISFVIHHANPYQKYYEEDILEYRKDDIVGHYRMS